MPIYAEKYAICTLCEICAKMWQHAKYVAIAYSYKTDMPIYHSIFTCWMLNQQHQTTEDQKFT